MPSLCRKYHPFYKKYRKCRKLLHFCTWHSVVSSHAPVRKMVSFNGALYTTPLRLHPCDCTPVILGVSFNEALYTTPLWLHPCDCTPVITPLWLHPCDYTPGTSPLWLSVRLSVCLSVCMLCFFFNMEVFSSLHFYIVWNGCAMLSCRDCWCGPMQNALSPSKMHFCFQNTRSFLCWLKYNISVR